MSAARGNRPFRRAATTLAVGTALSLAFGGVALADNIQDNIVDTGPSVSLVAGDANSSGTAKITVIGNNSQQDPDSGCNFDTAAEFLDLTINPPANVTVTPSTLRVTSCGTDYTVTFKALTGATGGTATASIATNATNGTFVNQVSIPITITQPPNTKPVLALTGVTNGAEYVIGTVPAANCEVTDPEDGNSTFPAVLSGTLTGGLGQQTATCDYTDEGGLKADTKTATYSIVPPPNIKPSVAVTGVTDGDSYEIGAVPTAGCDVTDAEDGNSTKAAVVTGTLSHGLGTQTATCDYTDQGGLEADTATATYTVVDTGDPTISGAVAPTGPDGSNGWYKNSPTVTFTCADAGGSGIQSCIVDGQTTASTTLGEGADQSVSGTATDWAGNTATDTVSNIDVDLTNPGATFDSAIGTVYFGSVPAAPTCTATDSLSGGDTCTVTGYSTAVGTHTLTATATDNAGRTGTAITTYTVSPWTLKGFYSPVDMGGVWNTVKGGSTVPLKFEAFSGTTELTNVSAIKSFTQKTVACPGATAIVDEIEITSTGGTSLRYDATGGQFIQNWATPKKPGTCQSVTVTTQDGTTISANFLLK